MRERPPRGLAPGFVGCSCRYYSMWREHDRAPKKVGGWTDQSRTSHLSRLDVISFSTGIFHLTRSLTKLRGCCCFLPYSTHRSKSVMRTANRRSFFRGCAVARRMTEGHQLLVFLATTRFVLRGGACYTVSCQQ